MGFGRDIVPFTFWLVRFVMRLAGNELLSIHARFDNEFVSRQQPERACQQILPYTNLRHLPQRVNDIDSCRRTLRGQHFCKSVYLEPIHCQTGLATVDWHLTYTSRAHNI